VRTRLGTAGLIVLAVMAPAAAAAEDDEMVTPQRFYATEVGDLDGDGATDVVTNDRVTVHDDTGRAVRAFHRLTARSGATGASLWVHDQPGSGLVVHPVRMPDGDGVVIERREGAVVLPPTQLIGPCSSSLPFTGCISHPTVVDAGQTALVAVGGDGSPRWTREFDYAVRAGTANPNTGLSADLSAGASQAAVPLHGSVDRLAMIVRGGPSANARGGRSGGEAAQLVLLDPASGETVATAQTADALGEVLWYPWPSLTADGDGLLLVSGGSSSAYAITGEHLWSADTDLVPGEYLYPLGDVDGDGQADKALSGHSFSAYPAPRSLVLSAAGEVLAARANMPTVFPAGDVDGLPGDEVVFANPQLFSTDAPTGFTTVVSEVVDRTGAAIRQGEVLVPTGPSLFGYTGWPGLNDLDGDGFGDTVRLRVAEGAIVGADLIGTDPSTLVPLRGAGDAGGWAGRLSSVLGPNTLVTIEGRAGRLVVTGTGPDSSWATDLGVAYGGDVAISTTGNDVDRLGPEDAPEGYLVNWAVGSTNGTALLGLDGALRWTTAG
jgi:hypothetical protein